jgi:RHS repeat-associated protein
LNRLEAVTYPADATFLAGRKVTYGYDDVGNRTSEVTTNPATGAILASKTGTFDNVNRLSVLTDNVAPAQTASFAWDRNGNQTGKTVGGTTTTYRYDLRDRMVEAIDDASILGRFQYDFEGRRTKKIGSDGIVQYVYDQASILAEYDATGAQKARYDYGSDRLISLVRSDEGRRWYSLDGLRSVVNLTDDSGAAVASYHLDAWGNFRFPAELTASRNRFAFTGYEWDPELGLFNAKARYFDPQIGRFSSQDSFIGQIDDPPSLHRYFYANANPTRFVDPTGFASEDATPTKTIFGLIFAGEFLDRLSKLPENIGQGLGNLLTPGQRPHGIAPGPFRQEQVTALEVARNPNSSFDAQVEAYEKAAKLHVGVVAEEIVRPVVEAPGRASAMGVHIEQAQRSHSPVDKLIHGLEAVKAGTESFTGLLTPFAIASSSATRTATAGSEAASTLPELATARPPIPVLPRIAVGAGEAAPIELRVLEPHFVPDPSRVMQNIATAANAELTANPALARTVLSRSEYLAGQQSVAAARMQWGNAVERLGAQEIRNSPLHSQLFEHVGGPHQPDFIGRGLPVGQNFDITTPGQVQAHLNRPGYGPGLNVVTYQRPSWFKLFP